MERGTFAIILSFIAVFFGIVAIITSRPYLLEFDTVGVMVTILCGLVALLIGWNIYQVIDLKSYKSIYQELSEKLEQETNYMHNKADLNQGLSLCFNAISLAGSISSEPKHNNKFQMYLQGANGLKILSNLEEYDLCNEIIRTLQISENASNDIVLNDKEREQIYEVLKEVSHLDKIDGLFDLIGRIKPKDSDNK